MNLMKLLSLPLLAIALSLHGCGKQDSTPDADAGKIKLFSLIPPVAWIASQIGGDRVVCHTLVPQNQSVHSYQPTPRDISRLQSADYYLQVGLPLEQQTIRKVLAATKVKITDITTGIPRRPIEAVESCDHDHDHNTADAVHDPHERYFDTHLWLSPVNNIQMARTIAALLEKADPAHSSYYKERLTTFITEMERVDAALKIRLAHLKGKKFFVYHPAFGYFADHYGMIQTAVETGGRSPTPKQLEALLKAAQKEQIRMIFVQPQFSPKAAESLAAAIKGKVIIIDPQHGNLLELYQQIADHLTPKAEHQ